MSEPNTLQMSLDLMLDRADKIVDVLETSHMPQFQDEYSQTVLRTVISGLIRPFLPVLQKTGEDGNVVHMDLR